MSFTLLKTDYYIKIYCRLQYAKRDEAEQKEAQWNEDKMEWYCKYNSKNYIEDRNNYNPIEVECDYPKAEIK